VTRPRKPPRYTVIPHPNAIVDVAALAIHGPEVVAAAEAIADDLAHGRVIGKELGDRHVSGNLTGFARVKFDVPDGRQALHNACSTTARERGTGSFELSTARSSIRTHSHYAEGRTNAALKI
jgi:hypothetical protein